MQAKPATRSASGLAWKKAEQEEAKKRMHQGRPKEGKEMFPYDTSAGTRCPDCKQHYSGIGHICTGQARDKIGERVGISGKSIDKIESGELSVNAVGVATSSNEDDRHMRLQA